jgi:hypothetical protein
MVDKIVELYYEGDRYHPPEHLDAEKLGRFPVGYRRLAYVQTAIGYEIKGDMPGLVGPAVRRLCRHTSDWLAGAALGDPLRTLD